MSFYLKFTLSLWEMFLKSSTGGAWSSNGAAHHIDAFIDHGFKLLQKIDHGNVAENSMSLVTGSSFQHVH